MCEFCESPRNWDNLGTLLTWENGYSSPDDNNFSSPCEFEMDLMERHKKSDYVILRVYKYDHSGVKYNTTGFSCRWDSGQCGYIYATKDDIRTWFNVKRITAETLKKALSCLESEVSEYSDWVNGECCPWDEDEAI